MINYIVIGITALISIRAFSDRDLFAKFMLNPYQVVHRKQYYRMLSHGFIHADWNHLIFNMLTLLFFGGMVADVMGILIYLVLYLGGMIFASLSSVRKHKDDYVYNSVGASGAVSAVLFASILLAPTNKIYMFFIPIGIPGFIFGILYLIYSQYMGRKNLDNINHDAHIMGALFGFTLPILIRSEYFFEFFQKINFLN